jgi:hypothetical protein
MTGFGGKVRRHLMADLAARPHYVELALPERPRAKVNSLGPAAVRPVDARLAVEPAVNAKRPNGR